MVLFVFYDTKFLQLIPFHEDHGLCVRRHECWFFVVCCCSAVIPPFAPLPNIFCFGSCSSWRKYYALCRERHVKYLFHLFCSEWKPFMEELAA